MTFESFCFFLLFFSALTSCFGKLIEVLGSIDKMYFAFLIDDVGYLDPNDLDWLPVIIPEVALSNIFKE